jgi:hypothetical protein
MRHPFLKSWVVLVLALALVLVAVAGCGGESSSDDGSSVAATADMSADQIVKESEAKMAAVTSGSFTADFALEIQGDASKMTDPTAQALLSEGIALHAEGRSANDPTAVDMTMSVGLAGQNLEFGMMSKGPKSWIEYEGVWYALDSENAKSLDKQAKTGAAPTEQLKSLGLDPSEWGTTYELAGTEDLNGVQVYHVKAVADPQKLADALMKAAEDPSLAEKLGGTDSELGQIGESLKQSKQQAEELGKSLKETTVDYWIGVDDMLMYKAQFGAGLDTAGQKDMEGVEGMTMRGTVTMADFDQPVTVTPPAESQPFDKLMEQMFGGMMSGSGTSF